MPSKRVRPGLGAPGTSKSFVELGGVNTSTNKARTENSRAGFIFLNAHEVLLYGSRGNMPGPQYLPSSVFSIKRGEHSAKPPEIRAAIEKMFPQFDERTRLELFARGRVEGWSIFGFEAEGPQ